MQSQCFKWIEIIKKGCLCLGWLLLLGVFLSGYFIYQLPDIKGLPFTKWPLPMYVYTQEGECIAEFGPRRHQAIEIEKVPLLLQQAFFAIEDKRFLEHRGIDIHGLLRAGFELLTTGRKSQGGSTITMQVARNYYLTREKSFLRKIREIFLALKIEQTFTKKEILEFYLNKIYMGYRTFGIGAAAEFYCQKPFDQLTLAEMALLAGLPQAPALLNPIKSVEAAKKRRDLVLYRLYCLGFIEKKDYVNALAEAVFVPKLDKQRTTLYAPYVANMAQEISQKVLGSESENGIHIYTTLSAHAQRLADEAITTSLLEYDQNHGYRGPEKHLKAFAADPTAYRQEAINFLKTLTVINGLLPAVVVACDTQTIQVMLSKGECITIKRAGWEWSCADKEQSISHSLKIGDVVRVYEQDNNWRLAQIPQIQNALVALNPQDGAIKALSGGFSYTLSQFNRVTSAKRQTGSSFKPFIYAAAFEKKYNLSDVFNDAPLVFDIPHKEMPWRPQNATQSFDGLTRLRVALVMSINLVTIRLLQTIGISYALDIVKRFGFDTKSWPNNLSLALGSIESTPLEMARGYAVFANGGYLITPYLIDHITDYKGRLLYQASPTRVPDEASKVIDAKGVLKHNAAIAPRVISNEATFLVNSALKGVIPYSGEHLVEYLGRKDLAGKTGTTNDSVDSWFIGYNNDYVASVWMGLDQRQPLYEYAHTTALPLWARFIKPLLEGSAEKTWARPKGVVILPMNPETGLPMKKPSKESLYEYFQLASLDRYKAAMAEIKEHKKTVNLSETPLF